VVNRGGTALTLPSKTGGTERLRWACMSGRPPALALGALIVGSAIAIDPYGLAPFGPFTNQDLSDLMNQQAPTASRTLILHTTDGINWSRDELKSVAGADGYSPSRVQVTQNNVLVTLIDPASRDAAGVAKTVVLVGTPKS
jgi:hypothetical protein